MWQSKTLTAPFCTPPTVPGNAPGFRRPAGVCYIAVQISSMNRSSTALAVGFVAALLAGAAAPVATPTRPARAVASAPSATPTAVPTPVPPPRIDDPARKGGRPLQRVARFPSRDLFFSRLLRVEEIDLDRDGEPEVLIEGIGTIRKLPNDIPTLGFVSRSRLPFESPLLTVLKRSGDEWEPLWLAHIPLRCGQSDDLNSCDQLIAFRTVRFRFDDRPQVVVQLLHPGETGANETYAYRLVRGKLERTFSVSLPRSAVEIVLDPNGIQRRLAVDTFVNRDLPGRYRSFTLKTFFVFGESRFRIYSETVEEPWSDRGEVDLAYWGLVHQSGFSAEVDRLRDRHRKEGMEAWATDPAEVVKRRFPDAQRPRVAFKQSGVGVVEFDRPGGCHAHVVVYQPIREWEGEKSFWEIASLRGQKESYECLEEPPLALAR